MDSKDDNGGPDQPDPIPPIDNEPVVDDQKRQRPLLVTAGIAALAVIALLAVVFGGSDSGSNDSAGIADLVFLTDDGQDLTLADFRGEPLVVNFFASWCAPCRAELPDFEEVHVASGGDVQFIGVSHDIDQSAWKSLIAETGISFPTVYQPEQEIWETLNLFGMPATAFITADGEVAYTFSGPLNSAALKELIAEHLSVTVEEV